MLIYAGSSNRISGTPSNFELSLRAEEHKQTDEFQISLIQAIIPFTWNSILKDDWFIFAYIKDGIAHTHKIDYGYNSGNYYIADIQNHLQSRLNLYSIGFTWSVQYNKQANLFTYTHTELAGLTAVSFSFVGAESNSTRSLHRYMGFEFNQSYPFSGTTLASSLPIVVNSHFIMLKMNSVNQTTKNMAGASSVFHHSNVMCRIPIMTTYASNLIWQSVDTGNSTMNITKLPSTIHITLEDDRGHELPLLNNWYLTLQATQIRDSSVQIMKSLNAISKYLENLDELQLLQLLRKEEKERKLKNNSTHTTEEPKQANGTMGHN